MKHAFIFGTSIFLSEYPTLTFANEDHILEFLRITSFYNRQKGREEQNLTVDANIYTIDNSPVSVKGNQLTEGSNISIHTDNNRIKIFSQGHHEPVLDVYQLDEHEYAGLSSHVLNEIEAQQPDAVLTIKGNFRVGGSHFEIENEKMFIDTNAYANGVVNAHKGVILSPIDLPY